MRYILLFQFTAICCVWLSHAATYASRTSINTTIRKTSSLPQYQQQHVNKQLIIKRGDLVTIRYKGQGFVITSFAKAEQDAAVGDTIVLTRLDPKDNDSSKKKYISAVVVAPNLAEIKHA